MSHDYIVSTFSRPKTPVITYAAGGLMRCQCGNEDQDEFLTVTNLAGDVLRGFVCGICEKRPDQQLRGET